MHLKLLAENVNLKNAWHAGRTHPQEICSGKPKVRLVPVCKTNCDFQDKADLKREFARIHYRLHLENLYEKANNQQKKNYRENHSPKHQNRQPMPDYQTRLRLQQQLMNTHRKRPKAYEKYEEQKRNELSDYEINLQYIEYRDGHKISPELYELAQPDQEMSEGITPAAVYYETEADSEKRMKILSHGEKEYPVFAKVLRNTMENDTLKNKIYNINFYEKSQEDSCTDLENPYDILHPSLIENLLNKISLLQPLIDEEMQSFIGFLSAVSELCPQDIKFLLKVIRKRNIMPDSLQEYLRQCLEQLIKDVSLDHEEPRLATEQLNFEGAEPLFKKTKKTSNIFSKASFFVGQQEQNSKLMKHSGELITPGRLQPTETSKPIKPLTFAVDHIAEFRTIDKRQAFEKPLRSSNFASGGRLTPEQAREGEKVDFHLKFQKQYKPQNVIQTKTLQSYVNRNANISRQYEARLPSDRKYQPYLLGFHIPDRILRETRSKYPPHIASAIGSAVQSLSHLIRNDSVSTYKLKYQRAHAMRDKDSLSLKSSVQMPSRLFKTNIGKLSKGFSRLNLLERSSLKYEQSGHQYISNAIRDSKQKGYYKPIDIDLPWGSVRKRINQITEAYIKATSFLAGNRNDRLDLMDYLALRSPATAKQTVGTKENIKTESIQKRVKTRKVSPQRKHRHL